MEEIYIKAIFIVLSYLVGGIPFGYILVRIRKGTDIRDIGSGNIGATNVTRVGGPILGVLTLILDFLKGIIPTLIATKIWGLNWGIVTGLASIVGHIFTPYLGFKGGKGIATGLGVFTALLPMGALIGITVWCIILLLFRYVSLASLLAVLSVFVYTLYTDAPSTIRFITGALSLLIVYRHKDNLKRLLRGKEPKVGKR